MFSFQSKNIFVTGADGFIGSHLTEALATAGANVTALVQYNSFGEIGWLADLPEDLKAKINIQTGDVRDPHLIKNLVNGNEIVFHLAALIGIPYSYLSPQSYLETNVGGTLNILEACRNNPGVKLVQTSTSEVYGTAIFTPISETHPLQAQSPYSASKIGADHIVQSYQNSFDVNAAILRPFNTYGPRQSERAVIPTIIRQLLDPGCKTIKLGSIDPVRDFNYIDDTVNAFLALSTSQKVRAGQIYNVGSGRGITIEKTIELLMNITGIKKPLETDQRRIRPLKSEVHELIADATKLKNCCDWQSKTSLQDGLTKTVRWWQKRFELEDKGARFNYSI
jgi:UDP-glucose 4-epimerase